MSLPRPTPQRDQFRSLRYLDMLATRLPPCAKILDVGCGAGLPIDRYLIEHGFHGTTMFWSHYDAATNRRLVEEAGFSIVLDERDTSNDERHQVLLAEAM